MSAARGALIVLGVATCALAGQGLLYNIGSLQTDFSRLSEQVNAPHFSKAFYAMSTICIAFYVALVYVGIQFIRGKTNVWPLFLFVLVFELFYQLQIGSLWLSSEYGMSIAAATGVANGGLMYQIEWFFPLWAPIVAYFASRRLAIDAAKPPVHQRVDL